MNDEIRHRGPDGEGYVALIDSKVTEFYGDDTPSDLVKRDMQCASDDKVGSHMALGHRRLAIVDTSSDGHQPKATGDGKLWVAFNGEIYNHAELRDELERDYGIEFYTSTDTEVVLHAYRVWGQECQERFIGMWAIIILDLEKMVVFFSRDRFGIKPLYYWKREDGALFFASEIKQFTCVEGWRASLNRERAFDYLVHGLTDHTEETLFENVFQLKPGFMASLDLSECLSGNKPSLEISRWYELSYKKFQGSYSEAIEEFKRLFFSSVNYQMKMAVPMGTSLSGGLDSSSIVCAVNEILKNDQCGQGQKTFSACSKYPQFDESEYMEAVFQKTGVENHRVVPSLEDSIESLDRILWHHDEPYGSTSIHAEWEVFSLASAQGVKVSLDGHGADEQLLGYQSFFSQVLAGDLRAGRFFRSVAHFIALRKTYGSGFGLFLRALFSAFTSRKLKKKLDRIFFSDRLFPSWLNRNYWKVGAYNPYTDCGISLHDAEKTSLVAVTSTSVPMQLVWADRDSMAHSLECRVPFLDHRLVEFSLSLPTNYKLCRGITKKVLRSALEGVLPEKIINRYSKLGFVTPEQIWVTEENPDWFREELYSVYERCRPMFNDNLLVEMEKIIEGTVSYNSTLWRMICFGRWVKMFNVQM